MYFYYNISDVSVVRRGHGEVVPYCNWQLSVWFDRFTNKSPLVNTDIYDLVVYGYLSEGSFGSTQFSKYLLAV